MTTTRVIKINIDSAIGQRIYWLIVELTRKYPDDFEQIKSGEI